MWSKFGCPILRRTFCRVLHLYANRTHPTIFRPLRACYGLFVILPCFIINTLCVCTCHGNLVFFSSHASTPHYRKFNTQTDMYTPLHLCASTSLRLYTSTLHLYLSTPTLHLYPLHLYPLRLYLSTPLTLHLYASTPLLYNSMPLRLYTSMPLCLYTSMLLHLYTSTCTSLHCLYTSTCTPLHL